MKNKISIILVIVLAITSCISTGIAIYQSKNYVKIPKQYRCESEEQKLDNMNYKQIVIINVNSDQYVENYQNKNISTYLNEEDYNAAKTIENTDMVTYSFDDDQKVLLADYQISYVTNANGENVSIWYKEYIKNLEASGLSCKIVK